MTSPGYHILDYKDKGYYKEATVSVGTSLPPTSITIGFTPDNKPIGSVKDCEYLLNTMRLKHIQRAHHSHHLCSMGFDKLNNEWYGWATIQDLCGFGLHDMMFDPDFEDPEGGDYSRHGDETILTLSQAKESARCYAIWRNQ